MTWYGSRNKGKNNKITRPYLKVSEATKHHAETRDPPARIPEITWRSRQGITCSHFEANNDKAVSQRER